MLGEMSVRHLSYDFYSVSKKNVTAVVLKGYSIKGSILQNCFAKNNVPLLHCAEKKQS